MRITVFLQRDAWVRGSSSSLFGREAEVEILACEVEVHHYYDTKKLSYFVSNKDELPPLSRSNLVYEVACPGCGKTYIGMTQRCLSVRLKEHATRLSSSAVGQHFSECEHAQFLYI
jgi:predicted RNA-binding Zn-ribbon protein involved in translation (DUF1610 family)